MSRPDRLIQANGWYHIYNQANGRKTLFLADKDYQRYLKMLENVCKKYDIECHAYCLMKNHYHLLLHIKKPNLSKAMQDLFRNYALYLNRRLNSVGPVFRERFQSRAITNTGDLINISRYIHLNPVSAKLCRFPEEHYWSSYQYFIDLELPKPDVIERDYLLGFFLNFDEYKEYVELGVDSSTQSYYNKQYRSARVTL